MSAFKLFLMLTHSNAFKRNALRNGLPAKKILNVFLLCKTAKKNVEARYHAGLSVFLVKVAKLLLILADVLKQTTAFQTFLYVNSMLMPSSLLKTASNKSVLLNFKTAKKILNASPHFKIVKGNAPTTLPAGLIAFLRKVISLPLTYINAF